MHERTTASQVKMMKKRSGIIYLAFLFISLITVSNEQEYEGGFVNGQQVGKCVAGFCLPSEYLKLETPCIDCVNRISIETDIMDVLMVSSIVVEGLS